MPDIKSNLAELVGRTPLLELSKSVQKLGLSARILAKLEFFNPAGSVKDRIAAAMIDSAESQGLLKKNSVIIEPTSGNTGIALAAIAAAKGYRAMIVMPDSMSVERRKLISAYGAEICLTDGELGMKGAIEKAEELAREIPNGHIPGQFVNPANPDIHKKTTGPEIWNQTCGRIDLFVSGVGTGGTITGTGSFLKEKNPKIRIIAVEPAESPVLSGGAPGKHGIQGIGAGFLPQVLDTKLLDEIVTVSTQDAFEAARKLAKTEGILAGVSSGAAAAAAFRLAAKPENAGKTIAVILPDGGERYLSGDAFKD